MAKKNCSKKYRAVKSTATLQKYRFRNKAGSVYWGKTRYIDYDEKPRRRYVVVSDNGCHVKVAKLTSLDKEKEKDPRFVKIEDYPQLKEKTGIFNKLYTKKYDRYNKGKKTKLTLGKRNGVFDEQPVFELTSNDLHKAKSHVVRRAGQKRK